MYVRDPETGSEVSSISYSVLFIADWEGTISSFSFQGTSGTATLRGVDTISSSDLTFSRSTLPKNAWVGLSPRQAISLSTINSLSSGAFTGEQDIYIDIAATVVLSVTNDAGESDSKTATGTVTVRLRWMPDETYTSLSLTALTVNISPAKALK